MGSFGIWHLITLALYVLLVQWPLWRIVSKAGFHGAWSLLALLPLVNFVAYWIFALKKWPVEGRGPQAI